MKTHRTFFNLLVAILTLLNATAWAPAMSRQDTSTIRIRFASGATSAVTSGDLAAFSSTRYVLYALAGQLLDATLSAPQGVTLKATTLTGRALTPVSGTSGSTGFRGYLPYSGNYYLTVTASNLHASYSLNVSIPVRVSFSRGATSDTKVGRLGAQQSLNYILRAQKGQLLEIDAMPTVAGAPLQLVIYGVDGTVLMSGMGESSTFRGELPLSQDYLVSVRAADIATDFTLSVIIPVRIQFQPGAVSASLPGWLAAQHVQYYVLRAMAGQTMRVNVTPQSGVRLVIYGADGTVLMSGMGEGASFHGVLPSSQDYILAVHAGPQPVAYMLHTIIR